MSDTSKTEVVKAPVKPQGWRILVDPVQLPEVSEGGIAFAAETQELWKYHRHFGQVVELGPLAYKDERFARYGNPEPWCKVGDWVTYPKNAGVNIAVKVIGTDGEPGVLPLLLLNDDDVLAVIDDPKSILLNV